MEVNGRVTMSESCGNIHRYHIYRYAVRATNEVLGVESTTRSLQERHDVI